jgi:hypothetical protein
VNKKIKLLTAILVLIATQAILADDVTWTLNPINENWDIVTVANKRLTPGTVFTAISNTSANPITGTFTNLPDDSTFTVGGNTYQVDYQGGDGNDLTLTVVP